MENKPKKREWVKNAAIIFLAVMLVFTFFSNSFRNRYLPEVSGQTVVSGSITAKVRGTGTVTAIGNTEIKAEGTTSIASVRVKEGQEVKAGDPLIILGERSEELEQAEEELEALRYQLKRLQNSYTPNTASVAVKYAEQELQDAIKELDEAERELKNDADIKALKEQLDTLDAFLNDSTNIANYQDASGKIAAAQENLAEAERVLSLAEQAYYEDPNDTQKEMNLQSARTDVSAKQTALTNAENLYDGIYKKYNDKQQERDAVQTRYDNLYSQKSTRYQLALKRVSEAETALNQAYEQEASSNAAAGSSTTWIDIQEVESKIARLEKKIAELSGGEDNAVTAPVAGTISSVSVSPGAKVAKGDVMLTIEVPDMGYQVSFSVSNDQAKRLKVGDSATVSNYYWGSEITAKISSIKTDPKNPQTNKLITFDLDGNVTSGSELTISVGQKSASYDLVLPASAVRTDSNGTFVLKVEAKNSALGNRYMAQRVSVDVLATDDVSTAVSGDISVGDFVITTSSAPIKNGDQVRMNDSN